MSRRQITVNLPTLHEGARGHLGQVQAYFAPGRFKAIRCGRRWGKTDLGKVLACDGAIRGQNIGWFTPTHKFLSEAYIEIKTALRPVTSSSNKTDGVIRTITNGRIDFWSLENELAGRSRKYHLVIIDEAAHTKENMRAIWERAIRPTLTDYRGSAIVMSSPNGSDPDNFLWQVCNIPEMGFVEFHAPIYGNPYLDQEELDTLERENPPLVFQQEYLGEFVDWSGKAFLPKEWFLVDGMAVDWPHKCDMVFAVVDTAAKDGAEHDGTAAMYFAISLYGGVKLTILDWDVVQIAGDLLPVWLKGVHQRCQELALQCRARQGSRGIWVEDKSTGTVIIQQSQRAGAAVFPIDTKLTEMGKEERAVNASRYIYRGDVKFSSYAYDKALTFKADTRNHMLTQVCGFKMGQKKGHDDLLDCATYGVAIGLGDASGW